MAEGLRVEVGVSVPGDCPVAEASADTDTPVSAVSRTSVPDTDGRVTEEFTLEGKDQPPRDSVSAVAQYNGQTVYSFERIQDDACVCESIEAFGFPVSEISAERGTLYVTFHAPEIETVEEIIETLQDRFAGIKLQKLTRSDENARPDLVFVDRSRLTFRQREVLQTAYDMGYFDHPKGANASDIAEALDISQSTFSEHLSVAQDKILEAVLAG